MLGVLAMHGTQACLIARIGLLKLALSPDAIQAVFVKRHGVPFATLCGDEVAAAVDMDRAGQPIDYRSSSRAIMGERKCSLALQLLF